ETVRDKVRKAAEKYSPQTAQQYVGGVLREEILKPGPIPEERLPATLYPIVRAVNCSVYKIDGPQLEKLLSYLVRFSNLQHLDISGKARRGITDGAMDRITQMLPNLTEIDLTDN